MAAKTTKDTMGWFKLNVGMFTNEIVGWSDTHVAIYIKLLTLYWSSGNKLPEINSSLYRRLGIIDSGGEVALASVLNEFFPRDSEDKYFHIELDRQLNETIESARLQSERASKSRGSRIKDEDKPDF